MGTDITKGELVGFFVRLLKDTEAEVRTAASLRTTGVCSMIPKDMAIKQVLPCIKELVTDSSQHVRGMPNHSSGFVLIGFMQLLWLPLSWDLLQYSERTTLLVIYWTSSFNY